MIVAAWGIPSSPQTCRKLRPDWICAKKTDWISKTSVTAYAIKPSKNCRKTVQKPFCTVASVCIPTGDALSDAKNGHFAHFCTSASVQHGAVGADGAPGNVLYKNPESILYIEPLTSAINLVTLKARESEGQNHQQT
jgi:hypothetical protein